MSSASRSSAVTWLASLVITYMLFFKYFRELDAYGLFFTMLACLITISIAGHMRLFTNLIPFYIFSIMILIISLFDGMPDSWTRYHDSAAAIRQWAWLPVLTLTGSAIFILLCEHWRWISRNSLWLAIAIFVITRLVRFATGGIDNINMQFFIYGLDNENAAIAALVFVHMHYNSSSKFRATITGFLYLLMASSQTSLIAGIVSIIALWPRFHKPLLGGLVVSGLLFIASAQIYYRELMYIDPNSSFRGLVWRDSTQIMKDTMGFGVGYGTEYIKNDFRSIDSEFDQYIAETASDRLFIGTHSSLYDVAIRTGLIGILLLITGLLQELKGKIYDQRLANLRVALVGSIIFNNLFNMGLASINVTMGTALFFALAIFCVHRRPPLSAGMEKPMLPVPQNLPNA
jgi:O-Antigen ligase